MLQTYPGACIAGKPAPTSAHKPLANAPICPCGSRLAGDASDKPGRLHRWQASSHNCTQAMGQYTNMPMWEPACRCCFRQTRVPASLASQLPQLHTSPAPMPPICPCGNRLAGAASDKPGCLHRWQASSHKCTQALRQYSPWEPACRRCFRHTAAPASLASQLPQVHTNHGPLRPVGAGLPAMAAPAACYSCQPPPSAAYTSTNDNDTWAVLSTSAAWLASNAFCTVNTFRKSTVPWAYC